jgi:hypothetical protein
LEQDRQTLTGVLLSVVATNDVALLTQKTATSIIKNIACIVIAT